MPRTQRIQSSAGIYHTYIRGINQQRIFEENEDYERFLAIAGDTNQKVGIGLLSYCLMNNHAHLLLIDVAEQTEEGSLVRLSNYFKILEAKYAQWFNKKYLRSGHLFQNRYKSKAVQSNDYLIATIDYIHQNPVNAGICKNPEDYPWSSRRLLGKSGSLIDENRLTQLASIEDIKSLKIKPIKIEPFDDSLGRKPRFLDEDAAAILYKISSVANTTEFLALAPTQQFKAVQELHINKVPIRQVARITGLSKGIIERWYKQDDL